MLVCVCGVRAYACVYLYHLIRYTSVYYTRFAYHVRVLAAEQQQQQHLSMPGTVRDGRGPNEALTHKHKRTHMAEGRKPTDNPN